MNISKKLINQYMAIFFNISPTSNHLHPLQVGNCDSNSRLVVDEGDNSKFRPERVLKAIVGLANYVIQLIIILINASKQRLRPTV